MDQQDSSPSGISSHSNEPSQQQRPPHQKRTRVLLSCGPCRNSKLKCDRGEPCTQCLKKDRADACVYAPKPNKAKPAKGMAARLKRLEGMVRDMMDTDGNPRSGKTTDETSATPLVKGQVVRGENGSGTYIGATHCMAMLEDVSEPIF